MSTTRTVDLTAARTGTKTMSAREPVLDTGVCNPGNRSPEPKPGADFLADFLADSPDGEALHCAMVEGCAAAVTHFDERGYVYCAAHGRERKCRKLRAHELAALKRGDTIRY